MQFDTTLNLAVVGHVDHGKSTLIGRLLHDTGSLADGKVEEIRTACRAHGHGFEWAYVMDHLEEERAGRLTIDTAQTFFRTARRNFAIIDAPGHKEFIRNMVTGAAQADAAVLVVDVCEGLREQTRRHAFFLTMLGVRRIVVLVNKMDCVNYDRLAYGKVADSVRGFLKSCGIGECALIPASARDGDNIASPSAHMPWNHGPTLVEALEALTPVAAVAEQPLRMPVQDVYERDGRRILAGRVESGSLVDGGRIVVQPSGVRARVAWVGTPSGDAAKAEPGECVGVALSGPVSANRGDVLCAAEGLSAPVMELSALVFWMRAEPLRVGERLDLRIATQETPCRVEAIGDRMDSSSLEILEPKASRLEETEVARVALLLDRPVVMESVRTIPELGRFVLCRGADVVAGGIRR